MRKRNLNNLFDTIFWYIIYAFPILAYFIVLGIDSTITIESLFNTLGLSFVTDNIFIQGLSSMFGVGGFLPLFTSNFAFYIFAWFCSAITIHIVVDVLVFVQRFAHKLMDSYSQRD